MAGERWAEVRDLLAQIDVARIDAAAEDWRFFWHTLIRVTNEFENRVGLATSTGMDSGAADGFLTTAEATSQALRATLREVSDPAFILRRLTADLERVRYDMIDAEEDLGGHGWPAVPSEDPDLRLLQEWQLGRFDLEADGVLARIGTAVRTAADELGRFGAHWPPDLPQADRSADPASVGPR